MEGFGYTCNKIPHELDAADYPTGTYDWFILIFCGVKIYILYNFYWRYIDKTGLLYFCGVQV